MSLPSLTQLGTSQADLKYSATCQWAFGLFLHPTIGQPLKPPFCYHWAGYLNSMSIVPYLSWLPRKPYHLSRLYTASGPILGTSMLPFSTKCWKRLNSVWCKYLARLLGRNYMYPASSYNADKMSSYLLSKDHVDTAWHVFDASQTQFAVSSVFLLWLSGYIFP